MKKLKAIGLIELLLVLVIMASLVILSVRYYVSTKAQAQINQAVSNIKTLYAACTAYYDATKFVVQGQPQSQCDLQTLVDKNYLPPEFAPVKQTAASGDGDDGGDSSTPTFTNPANPWGGNVTLGIGLPEKSCGGSSGMPVVSIGFTDVPIDICTALVKRMATSMSHGQCIRGAVTWDAGDVSSDLTCSTGNPDFSL